MAPKSNSTIIIACVAAVGLWNVRQLAFLPPAGRPARPAAPLAAAVGTATAAVAAPAAWAGPVDLAAKKLADASYPLLEKINWEKSPVLTKFLLKSAPSWDATKLAVAVDKTLELGVAMDPALVRQSVAAHDKALTDAMSRPGLVTPLEDYEAVTESIARMLGSAPTDKVRAVFDAYAEVGLKRLNGEWLATLKDADARAAYKAFFDLKNAQPFVSQVGAESVSATTVNSADTIGSAAKKLADASYPLLEQVDWGRTPVFNQWLSESSQKWQPAKIAAAVESTLALGLAMDQKLIAQSVATHDKAIDHALSSGSLVTPLEDHEAVTESIARMLASAPAEKIKAVFDTFSEVGLQDLNGQWFSTLKSSDAQAAYQAFIDLSEVVKSQR